MKNNFILYQVSYPKINYYFNYNSNVSDKWWWSMVTNKMQTLEVANITVKRESIA